MSAVAMHQARLPLPSTLEQIVEQNLIYALVDPRTDEVRYIGKTIRGVDRVREHLHGAALEREDNYKARWVKALRRVGGEPIIRILEAQRTVDDLNDAEVRWIAYGRMHGWPLTNLTDGGEGSLNVAPEIIEKRRQKMIGHAVSAETRAKISAANKQAYADPELRRLVGDRARGRHASPETRARISEANHRRYADPANRATQSAAQRRRFDEQGVSPETRDKLSAAMRRRWAKR